MVSKFWTKIDRELLFLAKFVYFMCSTTLLLRWRLKNKYFELQIIKNEIVENPAKWAKIPNLDRQKMADWLRLSLVAFQLWRVLEQLVPEIVLNYFFKTGDRSMVPLTQKMQKNSKRWKKRQKCIDITLRKWSWRPLWQVGKKTCWRFHRPPGELFEGFGIFPHLSTCLGNVEKSKII